MTTLPPPEPIKIKVLLRQRSAWEEIEFFDRTDAEDFASICSLSVMRPLIQCVRVDAAEPDDDHRRRIGLHS